MCSRWFNALLWTVLEAGNFNVLNDEKITAVESGSFRAGEPKSLSGMPVFGMSIRGWMRMVVALVVFLLIASAALWYVAQGLEEKVLVAIQPHLETDVEVGSVDMTLWSSWPDVEVLLNDVKIEDALDKGTPFLSLNSLGVAFDWKSVLMGGMEVSRIHLEGGSVRLLRSRSGRDNWKFWKDDAAGGSAALTLERLDLTGVLLEGEWWSPGEDDPLIWRAEVDRMRLDCEWKEGVPVSLRGKVDLEGAELTASGEKWLDGVDLESGLAWDEEIQDRGMWFVSLEGGEVGRGAVSVPFVAGLSGRDGFSMNLGIPEAEVNDLFGLTPGFLRMRAPQGYGLTGRMGLDVRVGRGAEESGWKGPTNPNWSGEWAVRLRGVKSASVNGDGVDIQSLRGDATVCSLKGGWQCQVEEMSGNTLGGEFRGSGVWQLQSGLESVEGRAEFVLRPRDVLALPAAQNLMPQGWTLEKGGALRGTGPFALERMGNGAWQWMGGKLEVALTQCQWDLGDGELRVEAASGEVGPSNLTLRLEEIRAPGLRGTVDLEANWQESQWQVRGDVQSADVEALLGWLPNEGAGDVSGQEGNVDWEVVVDEVKWGELMAREVEAKGTLDLRVGEGEVASLTAAVFGGRAALKGQWGQGEVSFDGRLSEAEIPEFLFQTGGLGQDVLLPQHARGLIWAEGRLGYRFDVTTDRSWSADLDLRMEEGELVDFDLLQRIPETLKEEGKYRVLADAEDLSRRLRRVRFDPIHAHVVLEEGVFTLGATEVISDAMNVGISGWQSLNGGLDYTLDFALRDLKSKQEEFGTTADDGLGHRFFLSIGGTLDEPLFGYDATAHKEHRKKERREAVGRLVGLISGEPDVRLAVRDTASIVLAGDSLKGEDSLKVSKDRPRGFQELDTDDDFKR